MFCSEMPAGRLRDIGSRCYPSLVLLLKKIINKNTKKGRNHTVWFQCFLCIFTDGNPRRGCSFSFSLAELPHLFSRPSKKCSRSFSGGPFDYLFLSCRLQQHAGRWSFIYRRGDHMIRLTSDISRLFSRDADLSGPQRMLFS